MLELHPCHAAQHFPEQVIQRPVARRGVLVRIGLGLGHRDQLTHRLCRKTRMHQQHIGHRADQTNGPEVLDGIKASVLVQSRVDRLRAADRHQERVAILGRFGDRLRAYVSARAGTIFHHDTDAAEHLAEFLADEPADDVIGAARRLRHNNHDRAVRIGRLRMQREIRRQSHPRQHRRKNGAARVA